MVELAKVIFDASDFRVVNWDGRFLVVYDDSDEPWEPQEFILGSETWKAMYAVLGYCYANNVKPFRVKRDEVVA